MRYLSKNLTVLLLSCVSILLLQACNDESVSAVDYFPLNARTTQNQEYLYNFFYPDGPWQVWTMAEPTIIEIAAGMTVDGRQYRLISNSNIGRRLVRKQGNRYFARDENIWDGTFTDEYLFLDSALPAGSTWSDERTVYTIKFTIIEKDASPEVHGKVFNNVIIVKEDYLRSGENDLFTGYRYYQKNVGEVYSYVPSPFSYTYADVASVLIE